MATHKQKANMPKLNDKLLDCVVRHITEHPQEYYQNTWCNLRDDKRDGEMCSTYACAAGWAVLLSTPVDQWQGTEQIRNESGSWFMTEGAKRLGITEPEAAFLFKSSETPRDPEIIKRRLRRIREHRGLPPLEYGLPLPEGDPDGEQKG